MIDKCINDNYNNNNNDPYINKQKPIKEKKTLSKNTPERLVNSSLNRIRQLLYMLFIRVPGVFFYSEFYIQKRRRHILCLL